MPFDISRYLALLWSLFFYSPLKRINWHNIREKTGSPHNRLQGQG
jgi:hypothetical protein